MASKMKNAVLAVIIFGIISAGVFYGVSYFLKSPTPESGPSSKGTANLSPRDDLEAPMPGFVAENTEKSNSYNEYASSLDELKDTGSWEDIQDQRDAGQNDKDGDENLFLGESLSESFEEESKDSVLADTEAFLESIFSNEPKDSSSTTSEPPRIKIPDSNSAEEVKIKNVDRSEEADADKAEIDAGPVPDPTPLGAIEYSTGQKLNKDSNIVRGKSVEAARSPSQARPTRATAPSPYVSLTESFSNTSQDSIITFDFVRDLARLLVNEYWPAGTHPDASKEGISTAGLLTLNNRYGIEMFGLLPTEKNQGGSARARILGYSLMPSMVDGLYKLYAERFISLVNAEAQEKIMLRGQESYRLTSSDIAEMYNIYAGLNRSAAGAIRSYFGSKSLPILVEDYVVLKDRADQAGREYAKLRMDGGEARLQAMQKKYEGLVRERERSKGMIANAMRRKGYTRSFDDNSLVYVATWLHRRDLGYAPGLNSLSDAFDKLGRRMYEEAEKYKNLEIE